MNKILFIVPPYVEYNSFVNPGFNERTVVKESGTYGSVITDMPIGLLSLSSYIKKHTNADIRLIDFNIILNKIENFDYKSFTELFHDTLSSKEWLDFQPDLIGISSLFTSSYYNMLAIGQVSRKIFQDAVIFAGGGVPTNMYNEIFNSSTCFDALCYGEGEKPLLELVKAKNKKQVLENHPSWITREKVNNKQIFQHDFIEDLDEIPFYDYSLLDLKEYGLSPTVKTYASFDNEKTIFHVATSRGCSHRCCFCSSHTVHGRKMRYHSVDRVKKDLTRLQQQYGAAKIGFQDDHFMGGDRERAFEIINTVKELNMTVFFQSGLALHALDRKMLETMKSAGINQLVLPVESGSERVLREIMHKPLNLSIAKRVVDDCRDLNIDTDANILIGLPGETKQDIEDSRAFLKTLGATWFRIYIATPLVGSEMYNICIENNYLVGSHIGSDFKRAAVKTKEFTPEYIKEKVYSLNLELNFIENSDFKLGNYQKALQGFENAIKVKNDHAIAYYFAAKCYQKMNMEEKYMDYKNRYEQIIKESDFWKNYAGKFNLPVPEELEVV